MIGSLPSPLSANDVLSLFEWFIGTMPPCDSSVTSTRAVWLLPQAARCPNERTKKTVRYLLVLRGADVHSRARRYRGLWKAGRARTESGRVDANRPTGAALSAALSRVRKVLLGHSGIAGKKLVQRQSVGLSLPGEQLPGRRSDWRAVWRADRSVAQSGSEQSSKGPLVGLVTSCRAHVDQVQIERGTGNEGHACLSKRRAGSRDPTCCYRNDRRSAHNLGRAAHRADAPIGGHLRVHL